MKPKRVESVNLSIQEWQSSSRFCKAGRLSSSIHARNFSGKLGRKTWKLIGYYWLLYGGAAKFLLTSLAREQWITHTPAPLPLPRFTYHVLIQLVSKYICFGHELYCTESLLISETLILNEDHNSGRGYTFGNLSNWKLGHMRAGQDLEVKSDGVFIVIRINIW